MNGMEAGPDTGPTVTIERKVDFLQQQDAYPFPVPGGVEVRETHMSWIFLVNGYAYKLKKPVAYPFPDLRTLEARYLNCCNEVVLNRRLAPHIYLGAVSLTIDAGGRLVLGSEGRVVDWLVQMRRIPVYDLLDYVMSHRRGSPEGVRGAADLLAGFYLRSPAVCQEPGEYQLKLEAAVKELSEKLSHPAFLFPSQLVSRLITGMHRFLVEHRAFFDKRVETGKIIEGHGDLRPEHICCGRPPAIIDCLEFNRDLRMLDTAEELSFLALECAVARNARIGRLFFDIYRKVTGDDIPGGLIHFYSVKRACLRAWLIARHVEEAPYRLDPAWLLRAGRYLRLAEHHLAAMDA